MQETKKVRIINVEIILRCIGFPFKGLWFIIAEGDFVGGGEIFWQRVGDFAGREPLDSADKGSLKAYAADRVGVMLIWEDMAKGGIIDTAFAISDEPVDRPIFVCCGVIGVRKNSEIFGGTSWEFIHFKVRGFPGLRKIGVNWMTSEGMDNDIRPGAMVGIFSLARRDADDFAGIGDFDCGAIIF